MFPEGRILEFVIVGAVALMVVGPKDLPILMRKVGQFVARMRAMAAEFRASFDEMARQSELDELRREVEAMRAGAPLKAAADLTLGSEAGQVFDDIHARVADLDIHAAPTFYARRSEVPGPNAFDEQPDLPFTQPPSAKEAS